MIRRALLAGWLVLFGLAILLAQGEAQFLPSVVGQKYRTYSTHFDGANDYLTRDADLTGTADGKQGLASFWQQTTATGAHFLENDTALAGATFRFGIFTTGAGKIQFFARNSAGTGILNIQTNAALNTGVWMHVMASWDLTDIGKRHLYVNGSSDLNAVTYTNDTIDYTVADWAIGAAADGSSKAVFNIGDLLFWPTYLDLSQGANQRLFYSNAKGVNPGSAVRQLGLPLINMSGPLLTWPNNKGSGGGFTVHGSPSAGNGSPPEP